jgi:hypothetical protein
MASPALLGAGAGSAGAGIGAIGGGGGAAMLAALSGIAIGAPVAGGGAGAGVGAGAAIGAPVLLSAEAGGGVSLIWAKAVVLIAANMAAEMSRRFIGRSWCCVHPPVPSQTRWLASGSAGRLFARWRLV